jgi:Family of unknown function (DUF695)
MWPFSRRQPDINLLPPLDDEGQRWGVSQGSVDGPPLIVRYNESAHAWRGHRELPIKLGFAIPVNSAAGPGLPDAAENQQLNQIEDVILREVRSRTRGIHALTLTTGRVKEIVLYIPRDIDIKSIHEAICAAVTTHEVQCLAVVEPNWDSFRQLAPR